jgi:hypothetical protein
VPGNHAAAFAQSRRWFIASSCVRTAMFDLLVQRSRFLRCFPYRLLANSQRFDINYKISLTSLNAERTLGKQRIGGGARAYAVILEVAEPLYQRLVAKTQPI